MRVWAYDDISPLGPLTETYHTFIQRGTDHGDRWVIYPAQHYFLLALAYGPYILFLMLTGQFSLAGAEFPYGFKDPIAAFRVLAVIARVVSVLMAGGIIVAAYRIGRLFWNGRAGAFAALCLLVQYPMVYYSKTACLEIPYLFWTSWALVMAAEISAHGLTRKRVAALAALAACAVATKDQAAGMFLLLPVFLWVLWRRQRQQFPDRWWKLGIVFVTCAGLTYAVGSGLAFDPTRYFRHLQWTLTAHRPETMEFLTWNPPEAHHGAGIAAVGSIALWSAGSVVRVLGILPAGLSILGLYLRIRSGCRSVWLAAAAASYWWAFLVPTAFTMGYVFQRYLIPVNFIAALFAGYGLARVVSRLSERRWAASILIALALGPSLWVSLDLLTHLWHDSRYEAERWFSRNAAGGDRVAPAHSVNALPRLPRSLKITQIPPGPAALKYLESSRPEFVTVIPDWTTSPGMLHSRMYPRELFAKLADGSLGYSQVANFDCGFGGGLPLLDYPSVSPPVTIYRRTVAAFEH